MFKLILLYSRRLILREWRLFVLPLLSLAITALVLSLILFLTNSSERFLDEQQKFLLGGDVVIDTKSPVNLDILWAEVDVRPQKISTQLELNGTLNTVENNSTFSVRVVDRSYPLYGELKLQNNLYRYPNNNEIYLDQNGRDRLNIETGEAINFGNQSFTVVDLILDEPTSLLNGFNFLPRAIISQEGFAKTELNLDLLNLDYKYAATFDGLNEDEKSRIKDSAKVLFPDSRTTISGESQTGLQFGLQIVANFLIISVLITATLAAVNVYSSTIYLITVERKSLAVLLSLGVNKRSLTAILGLSLAYTVLLASVAGLGLGILMFLILTSVLSANFGLDLPMADFFTFSLITLTLISAIALSSFIPAFRQTLSLKPKQILTNNEEFLDGKERSLLSIFIVTTFTLLPLFFLAAVLLQNLLEGVIAILIIGGVYIVLAIGFTLFLRFTYLRRHKFTFFIKSIISQKKADGLFGIVSLTSLFVALTAIATLTLVQVSLSKYLSEDLSQSVPTTYIIDVQPSQKEALLSEFPELELNSNTRARIISINNQDVVDMIESEDRDKRELQREFNLTARREMPEGDKIISGRWIKQSGEVSVDANFAERMNIDLGQDIVFLIQGFEVKTTITSLRETDSRSGLPFFFFILSPEDLDNFPGIYFGYAFYEKERRQELGQYIGTNIPNVSFIETENLGAQLTVLIETLMLVVFFVTLPPLIIATLLIATLVVSSFESRRRDAARLRALGARRSAVFRQYLAETLSLTLIAAVLAYLVSLGVTYIINYFFLELDSIAFYDIELLISFFIIIILVGLIGFYLFKSDKAPLRELLSYDQNR